MATERMDINEQIELIKQSPLFEEAWYLAEYPDVARIGMCPVAHYVRYGWRVGRNPSSRFHTRFYLEQYPDVARSGANPLVHYLKFGRHEGRSTGAEALRPRTALPPSTAAPHAALPALMPSVYEHAHAAIPDNENERLSLQLEQTQRLLEHYFIRCQELELRMN